MTNITIGQFFPGNSLVHSLDARFKIVITALMFTMLFTAGDWRGLAVGAVFILLALVGSLIKPILIIKNIKPLVPFLLVTAFFNFFFIEGDSILWQWHFIKISDRALSFTLYTLVRIVLLVIGSSLLTYTTSPIVLTGAIESLMKPLKIVKFPVHEFALMMTIALRFIPTLLSETEKIMNAQKARGADFETGNLIKRAKALVPIIIPLVISAFMRAEELATAMTCRCYRGGEGRTRLKTSKARARDFAVFFIAICFLTVVILLKYVTN
jgi:energy-coupling factor transport system permease protein